jgi:hypothetical protein
MTSVLVPIVALEGKGSVETLRNGFRARVYGGKDPITGQQLYLRGQVRLHREEAERDCLRLLDQVDAERHPDLAATLGAVGPMGEPRARVAESHRRC